MSDKKIILNYEGPIDYHTTGILLNKVKNDLASHDIQKVLKKRIYNILVECMENILHHNARGKENSIQPYIKLEKRTSEYRVTSGNLILNTDAAILREKLNKIVGSEREQLHKMYETQINKETIQGKDGAGLGLITIALKSNSQLSYKVIEVDDQHSVFELRVIIPIDNEKH